MGWKCAAVTRYASGVFRRRWVRYLFTLLALGLGGGFLVRSVPWNDHCPGGAGMSTCARDALVPGLRTVLATMDGRLLALGGAVYVLGAFFWALRWKCVLAVAPKPPRFGALLRASMEAYAAMALFVGGVGGDALRLAALMAEGIPAPWAAASLLVDRVIGLTALIVTAMVVAAPELMALHPLAAVALPGLLVALVGGLGAGLVAPLPAFFPVKARRVIEKLRGPYADVAASRAIRGLALSFAVSMLVAAATLGSFGLFLAAAHSTPSSLAKLLVGLVEAFVVNAIPTVPGGWGTGEAVFVYFLKPAHIDEAQALAASVAFRLSVFPVALVGVVSLALRARAKKTDR